MDYASMIANLADFLNKAKTCILVADTHVIQIHQNDLF